MSKVKFHDYCVQVESELDRTVIAALEEVAGEIESQAKENSRVGSAGAPTKNSFKHKVVDSEHTAYIGSNEKNAIWEELGTGEYALKGNGRQGAWYVPVEKVVGYKKPTYNGKVVIVYGKNKKKYYKTNGKKPSRALWRAYEAWKEPAKKRIENLFKEL
jgi:hypothetical protein